MMFVASVTLIYIRAMAYPASIIGGANVHVLHHQFLMKSGFLSREYSPLHKGQAEKHVWPGWELNLRSLEC